MTSPELDDEYLIDEPQSPRVISDTGSLLLTTPCRLTLACTSDLPRNRASKIALLFVVAAYLSERCLHAHLCFSPASWKDPEGKEIKNRTKAQATEILLKHREAIASGKAKFEDLAKVHSDCGSAAQGGDLGEFGRGAMQKSFEDGTYALKVGELSDVIDSDSGVHIILRTK